MCVEGSNLRTLRDHLGAGRIAGRCCSGLFCFLAVVVKGLLCRVAAVDTWHSIDTISKIALQEALSVTSASSRSEFEQQLCCQLLSLGEVAETLADRVMALEARLSALEDSQVSDPSMSLMDESTGELLSESEAKVQMLRERLVPASSEAPTVVELNVNSQSDQENQFENSLVPEENLDDSVEDESAGDDTEYVDDPQIDLLSA